MNPRPFPSRRPVAHARPGPLLPLLAVALILGPAVAATAAPARRIAVVVGANEAPSGRATLRYAHADARNVAAALVDVAGFVRDDVHVLLDPAPAAVLSELDAALGALAGGDEALLFFYFSGHSDARALYPSGRPLPLAELKHRLEDPRASVRVGVVDACSGGAWTGTKGFHPTEPFVVNVPFTLGAEGSALLAASSGAEDAHEYESLGGSFFTHHLVVGLRGAAERDGDGVVGLNEAFEYAKAGTLRDSAIYASTPQHPSFVMNLRGRSDLPLARLASADTRVELVQQQGPLEVIHLDQALVVLEVPSGERRTMLALPPGRYLVRRRNGAQTFAAEVQVAAGQAVEVREEALVLVGSPALAVKGPPEVHAVLDTTLPAGTWEVGLELGRVVSQSPMYADTKEATFGFLPHVAVGLGDRWQLSLFLPKLAYRFGDPGGTEVVVSAGLTGLAAASDGSRLAAPGAAVALRQAVGRGHALLATVTGSTTAEWGVDDLPAPFERWRLTGDLGWSLPLGERVTLTPGVGFTGRRDPAAGADYGAAVAFGSVLDIAGRNRPLIRVNLSSDWSLDGHIGLEWAMPEHEWTEIYAVGGTWTF